MGEFNKQQEITNKDLYEKINRIDSDNVANGKRLNAVEKELNAMVSKFDKMSIVLEKVHDKIDAHTESINDVKVQFPTFMNEFVEKNAKRTEEIVKIHQVVCSKEMDSKFLSLPEGWKGTAAKIFVFLIAGLCGLDVSGLLPISSKPETPMMQMAQRSGQAGSLILKDSKGNTYSFQNIIASETSK